MNLNTIPVTPHALGFIKVACEDDPLFGESRTRNEFLITQRHHAQASLQAKLAAHPLQEKLAREPDGEDAGGGKTLTEIPIRLFFNKAENAISIRYQAFSTPGNMPVCAGDGKNAMRLERAADQTATMAQVACPGPELCGLVQSGQATCRRQVRMAVQIEGQNDPLSVFEVRTGSLNTYRALKAQLQLVERRFKGLRHVPLRLALWQASNEASSYEPFSLMRLELSDTEAEAMKAAREARQALVDAGIDDEVDAIHCEQDGDLPSVGAGTEFQSVREFYVEHASRRAGAEGITPLSVGRQRAAVQHAGLASASIIDALRAATNPTPEPQI